MGQAITLYRINDEQARQLQTYPRTFSPDKTLGNKTFEQNFEGLIFLLTKVSAKSYQSLIQEIFYPAESFDSNTSFDPAAFDPLEDYSSLEESINYLNKEKILAIKSFLDGVDEHEFLQAYDPDELNQNEVYPGVWHHDESFERAFNKHHLREGLKALRELFYDAATGNNLIVSLAG